MYIFQFYPITYTTSIISSKKNVAPKTSATYSTVIVRVLPTYHTYAIHLFCCLVDVFLSSSSHMCLFLCVYINVNCTESKKKKIEFNRHSNNNTPINAETVHSLSILSVQYR